MDAGADGVFADAAVVLLTESLARTPRKDRGYVKRLSNLGGAHLARYRRTEDPAELERAHATARSIPSGL